MGVVYLAHQLVLDRMVALKLLAPGLANDETFRGRFLRESRIAASLDHPSIVPIFDAGEVDGQLYLAMRYVEGGDLRALLKAEGSLESARALAIGEQVAAALDAAHARGLVHRDVKPSNVLLDSDEHVYLADFGLSRRLADQGVPLPLGRSLGTAAYVAPEQIEGREVDGRADVYSLTCVLYECLAGEPPFRRASELAMLWAHLEDEPPGLPGLEAVLATALAKHPRERYPTCTALVEAAREAIGIAEPARPRWLRLPVLVGLAALAAVAVSLAAYFAIRGGGGTAPVHGDTLVRIDPAANKVVDSIPVGARASSVTFGEGYLWVTSYQDRTLTRIDPATGVTRVTKITGGTPLDVAVRGRLAVVTYGPFTVGYELIDAASGASVGSVRLPGADQAQAPVAAGPEGIWVAASGYDGENVGEVIATPTTSGPAGAFDRVVIPEQPNFLFFYTPDSGSYNDVAVGEGGVWLARDSGPYLKRIDASARRIVATIKLPFRPKSLATGEGAVWVTGLFDNVLARLDPATSKVTMTVPIGPGTDGIAVGNGSVWVASTIAGTVTRVDPRTGKVLATVDVGTRPEDVAVGAGGVWVTTHTA
jgi:YVTN family beta-propeller protein